MDRDDTATQILLGSLLREVSRSFYLTLRVLPRRIRSQIGLAYLLARTTDTIADTELVPLEGRVAALEKLKDCIAQLQTGPLDLSSLVSHQEASAERALLERSEQSLELLQKLDPEDQRRVKEVLATIISGQRLDLERFAAANDTHIVALRNDAELDDYTYRVAGCVGEFWTKMCRAHLFPGANLVDADFLAKGVRFGQGLQLTNILRDLPVDLRHGRCYLPAEALKACGLGPADLLNPDSEARLRKAYDRYLSMAEGHLLAGWEYTHMIPRNCIRLRLACAWPLLIGRETLMLLRTGKVLDHSHRIKVSRHQVRSIMWRSVFFYPWPKTWRALFAPIPHFPCQ
jgi:farnesyl-diphosphate farnesyltransferase